MNRRRRRANDFTESLNSLHCSEIDSDTLCSISQDSLDESRCNMDSISSGISRVSKHSIILAGSSSKHSFAHNTANSSTILSEIQPATDLNKRIDLFKLEQQCIKVDDTKENSNPQHYVKNKEIRNTSRNKKWPSKSKKQSTASNNKFDTDAGDKNSQRDSNYNVHCNKSNAVVDFEQNVTETKSTEKINSLYSYIIKDHQDVKTNSEDKFAHNEANKFETILCSLDNKFNQMKEVSEAQQILKRLSDQFQQAPKNFTEKLLTIIEESVINNDDGAHDTSAINLSRLTTEFRKMCKFIEDESAPEWPVSPLATPPCQLQIFKKVLCTPPIKDSKNEHTPTVSSTPITPMSGVDILRKRFLNKISKNNGNGSTNSINNESGNASFEWLEAHCNRLFPEEEEHSKSLRKSLSMTSLLSMSQIEKICEEQMALLNTTTSNGDWKTNLVLGARGLSDTQLYHSPSKINTETNYSKLKALQDNLKNLQCNKVSYSKKKFKKLSERAESHAGTPDNCTNGYAALNPDELEKTLLQDIAEKRKRCLDTARLISEINADPEAVEAHKTLKMSSMYADDTELNSLSHDESKFLKTLMSCKDYQLYLEKQKPLFKLLQNSNNWTPETSCTSVNAEEIKCTEMLDVRNTKSPKNTAPSPNVNSRIRYKSPLLKTPVVEKKGDAKGVKSKLFVTPGKSPVNNPRKKKEYFPNMYKPAKSATEQNILKSPHAEGLYRLNYNTIISPVAMYINGTDTQLLKNVRAKAGKLLFSPVKNSPMTSPHRSTKQHTPSKSIIKAQSNECLKLNLSPKVNKNVASKVSKAPENDATHKHDFILPKVSYNLPLQVKTIKENKSFTQGPRVKKLLEATHSKVVIRHKARTNSIRKEKNGENREIYEISYAPEDESIHIEQAAIKTNFINKPRYM